MVEHSLMLPGEIVKKDNRLVRTKISVQGVDAGRLLANLIACIRVDDAALAETYKVAAKDFLADIGGEGYKHLREVCRELAKATAELEEPDEGGPHPVFTACPFFTKITYRRGVVSATFNPVMSDYLLLLKQCFTQYNLIDYLKLSSVYSQRMFEILKSWGGVPEVVISMSELHRMLNTPPSFQANFKEFRRRILEKAHKDLSDMLPFTWEAVKAGRSVERIRFIFKPGRGAIASEEKRLAQEEKRHRLEVKRIESAMRCAKGKNGDCRIMDNKRLVCRICRQEHVCEGMRGSIQPLFPLPLFKAQ